MMNPRIDASGHPPALKRRAVTKNPFKTGCTAVRFSVLPVTAADFNRRSVVADFNRWLLERQHALALLLLVIVLLSGARAAAAEPPVLSAHETSAAAPQATTYYIRPDGGSPAQCTGQTNAPYPGSGLAQACAWDHPFRALPPGGAARIAGGDTLIIGAGEYMMGYGAPGADSCSSDYPYGCHIPPIPGGPDASHLTRILGAGWDAGCSDPPELWGTERTYHILDLTDSSNVEIACLEITDHSGCVEFHSGSLTCQRDSYPYGPWASAGLYAEDSANVYLHDLDIHGLASTGVWAGRLSDWTVEDVRVAGNGWIGWDGDIDGDDSNTGTLNFNHWTVEWNGCGETYPGGEPAGCWGQTAGGYGDGVGTGATGGDWIIEDSAFLHNTSDGLDLLYHTLGGSIQLNRVRAEGNAGNQIKVAGQTEIRNSILVGNCAFFDGQPFTHNVDPCRALGNTLSLSFTGGETQTLINNTVYGQGDGLVGAGPRYGFTCNGNEQLIGRNNLYLGDTDYFDPGDLTFLFYFEDCPGLSFDSDYSLYHTVKLSAYVPGPHDIAADPDLADPRRDHFDAHLLPDSPAIDAGSTSHAPPHDFDNLSRDASPDIGAYEHRPIVQKIRLYLNQILLDWTDIVGPGHHYAVAGSADPYFAPGDPGSAVLAPNLTPPGVGKPTSFTDAGHGAGDTYFYRIRAVTSASQTMAFSNRTGIFSFPLTSGNILQSASSHLTKELEK
jgi:hypothetical protein